MNRDRGKRSWRSAEVTVAIAALALLASGCQLPYLVSQLAGETQLLAGARPIDAVRADARSSATLVERLDEAEELLEFAKRQGFRVGDAYRTYSEPPAGYPVWIVSACPPDALEPVTWSFPLVGAFPYKGFFRKELAEFEADRLRGLDLEVDLRPALAFSTLGWFSDPLFPTLLTGDTGERAGGILHELAHRTVFVPGDARLNESISVSVEDFAVQAWLAERGEIEAMAEHRLRIEDREQLREAVAGVLDELRVSFEAPEREVRLAGKRDALERFSARFRDHPPKSARYGTLSKVEWTLPALLLIDVYGGDGPLLETVFEACNRSIPRYLAKLRDAAGSPDPRELLGSWTEQAEPRGTGSLAPRESRRKN